MQATADHGAGLIVALNVVVKIVEHGSIRRGEGVATAVIDRDGRQG